MDSFDYNVLQVYFTGDEAQEFEVLDVVSGKPLLEDKYPFKEGFKSKSVW